MKNKRKVLIILGSTEDLPQCDGGLQYLKHHASEVEVLDICIINTVWSIWELLQNLHDQSVHMDAVVVGAGCATTLPAATEEYLRMRLENVSTCIIGVAFHDANDSTNDAAARASIAKHPHTRVVCRDDNGVFSGNFGFKRACEYAVHGNFPAIVLPETRCVEHFSLDAAIKDIEDTRSQRKTAKYIGA